MELDGARLRLSWFAGSGGVERKLVDGVNLPGAFCRASSSTNRPRVASRTRPPPPSPLTLPAGCAIAQLPDAPDAPTQFVVQVDRHRLSPLQLCFSQASAAEEWLNVLYEAATGEPLPAPGGGGGGGGSGGGGAAAEPAAAAAAAAALIAHEGFLEVSTQNGEGWDRHWVSVCPHSRLLLFFASKTKAPGTERAAFDMLSSTLHETPPPGAPMVRGVVPAFWLSLDNSGVYGQRGGQATPATAVVASDPDDRARWLQSLTMAMDPSTMAATGGSTGASGARTSQLSFSLWHFQRNAGFLVSLGYPAERSVALNHEERTLCLWPDNKKKNLAAVLYLDSPNVKIDFGCETVPRPGWCNLRMDITAPAAGADEKYVTHCFQARTHEEFLQWASALAAL